MEYEYLVIVEGSRPEQLTEQFTHKSLPPDVRPEDGRPFLARRLRRDGRSRSLFLAPFVKAIAVRKFRPGES